MKTGKSAELPLQNVRRRKLRDTKGPAAKGPHSFFCQICIFEAGPFEDGRFVGVPNVPSQGQRIWLLCFTNPGSIENIRVN
jgi:hypothetical protein